MCGRYAIRTSTPELAALLGDEPTLYGNQIDSQSLVSYNVAPTQTVVAVRLTDEGREFSSMRWGLIPSWAKDKKIGYRLINARGETVKGRPAFRTAFRHRRCLIPASGFYEWKAIGKTRQPYYFSMRSGEPFFMAGLWETWRGDDEIRLQSCTIVTTSANSVVAAVHKRMPVILHPDVRNEWLAPDTDPARLEALLTPFAPDTMQCFPVSQHVNKPQNNDPECIAPVSL
ncbi:MAG: SOS response-associated peptidase [Pseudomonadota bacterium]